MESHHGRTTHKIKRSRSSSYSSAEDLIRGRRIKKHKKRKHCSSNDSSSSPGRKGSISGKLKDQKLQKQRSNSSNSSSSECEQKIRKNKKEKNKKKEKKKPKKSKKPKKTKMKQKTVATDNILSEVKKYDESNKNETSTSEPIAAGSRSYSNVPNRRRLPMVPMTKEEYEKQQSVIRRVYDPETWRNRLVRGDGEILEEIVSYTRHKEINKLSTKMDGESFAATIGLKR